MVTFCLAQYVRWGIEIWNIITQDSTFCSRTFHRYSVLAFIRKTLKYIIPWLNWGREFKSNMDLELQLNFVLTQIYYCLMIVLQLPDNIIKNCMVLRKRVNPNFWQTFNVSNDSWPICDHLRITRKHCQSTQPVELMKGYESMMLKGDKGFKVC